MSAHLHHLPDQFLRFVHTEDQNLHGGSDLPDLARRFEPVQLRHGDVQDSEVRFELLRQGNGLAAGSGFPPKFAVRLAFQQGTNTGPHYRVIISNEDAECAQDAVLVRGRVTWTVMPLELLSMFIWPLSSFTRAPIPVMPTPSATTRPPARGLARPFPLSRTSTCNW